MRVAVLGRESGCYRRAVRRWARSAQVRQSARLWRDDLVYAERLFEYAAIGPLDPGAARDAIGYPLLREGVAIQERALDFILERAKRHWGFATAETVANSEATGR